MTAINNKTGDVVTFVQGVGKITVFSAAGEKVMPIPTFYKRFTVKA